jgi:hypothetical protein
LSTTLKSCTQCHTAKPASDFAADSSRPTGIKSHCKTCDAAKARARRAANPDKYRAADRLRNAARKGYLKASNAKWRAANATGVQAYQATYRAEHRNEARARSAEWRAANPTPKRDPEKHAAWVEANKERLQRQAHTRYLRRSYGYAAARQRRVRDATPAWVDIEALAAVYELARRATEVSGAKYEVDHIIPLRGARVSGLNVPWNLRVIDRAWNREKHIKTFQYRGRANGHS